MKIAELKKILIIALGILVPFMLFAFHPESYKEQAVEKEKSCPAGQSPYPLFQSDSLIEITLEFEFDSIFSDLSQESFYRPGRLWIGDPGYTRSYPVEVKTRGRFRLDPSHCDFPPLKLDLKRKRMNETVFEGLKKVKMVTHCQDNFGIFEQFLLQEYLIYKCYSILTPYSINVRLAKVYYVDVINPLRYSVKYAFFLEGEDELAERNGGNILDIDAVNPENLDQKHYGMMALFQYMIINKDWSVPIMHNIFLLSTDYFEPPYTVPYDFDWAGLIDIPYRYEYSALSRKNPQREFKGPCLRRRTYRDLIDRFNEKKDLIINLYTRFPYLDKDHKERIINDIEKFYRIINDRRLFRDEILDFCR